MENNTLTTLLITIIGVLGGKDAWAYYKNRSNAKMKIKMKEQADKDVTRDDIRKILEDQIKDLKEQISILSGRVDQMARERENDKAKISSQAIEIVTLTGKLKGCGQ